MFNYEKFFEDELSAIKNEGRYRTFVRLRRIAGEFPYVLVKDGTTEKRVIVWCSNDYLGLSQHPEVRTAMEEALEFSGAGSGGTRNISGNHDDLVKLEELIASVTKKEAALVFSSGYVANQTGLATISRLVPEMIVLSDSLNHDSIIQGLRLGRAEKKIFRHNDLEHLREQLNAIALDRPKLIVVESLYSMEGDFAPLQELCDIAELHGAMLYVDETHAFGVYGSEGGGVVEQLGLSNRVHFIQGGLGKAVGVVGGFISGSAKAIDFIRSFGNGFIFTTSLPPIVARGAHASVEVIRRSSADRKLIQDKALKLKALLKERGIEYLPGGSHIVPVMVRDAKLCKILSDTLLKEFGIYVQPINFPTVPRGEERLRVNPTPFHDDKMLIALVEAIDTVFKRHGLILEIESEQMEFHLESDEKNWSKEAH